MSISQLSRSKKTILAADDQEGQRLIFDLMFSSIYDLVLLKDGKEVLDYLKLNPPPDLIILDVEMPEVNGLDVCSRIKRVGRLKEIPVVIVTSLDDVNTKTLAQMSKADKLISKPLSGKNFSAIVSEMLNKVPQA